MEFHLNLDSEKIDTAHPVMPLSVDPALSLREVFTQMKERKTGSVVVCRAGKLVGIFTERDALNLMAKNADLDQPIERVMVAKPVTMRKSDTVATAVKKMAQGGYRRLPIVEGDGAVVGLLKVSGIVRYLVEHFPQTVYNLPPDPNAMPRAREGA